MDEILDYKKMAGVEGFEPTTNGLTVRCATTAPHPKICELYL